MKHLIALICAFLVSTAAQAQWPGQCPAGVASTSIGCQPPAATLLPTDLVTGWQVAQAPKTRAVQIQQILSGGLPASFSTLTTSGAATLNGGGALAGTFTGSPTFFGSPIFQGTTGLASLAINSPAWLGKFGWISVDVNGSGTITWGPSTSNIAGKIPGYFSANVTGVSPITVSEPTQWLFAIASDTLDASLSNGFNGATFVQNIGGGSTKGGHAGVLIRVNHVGNVAPSTVSNETFIGALNLALTSGSAFTGVGGNVIAFNPQVIVTNTASGVGLLEAIESVVQSDIALPSRGWAAAFSGGTFKGNKNDWAYGAFSNVGTVQFKTFGLIGRHDTPFGLSSDGSLFSLVTQTNGSGHGWINPVIDGGVYLPNVNFTNGPWKTPRLWIDGNAAIYPGTGIISPTSTGMSMDVGGWIATFSSIASVGAAYLVGDQLVGPDTAVQNGGIFVVDTINGTGGVTLGHFLPGKEPISYGGSRPTHMILAGGSSATGGVDVNITWTQLTRLDIGNANALTVNIGANATTGITTGGALAKLAFYGGSPIVKATPVGACAGNTGCQALRDALGNLGLIATGSISN